MKQYSQPFSILAMIIIFVIIVAGSIISVNVISEAIGMSFYIPHKLSVYVSLIFLLLTYWILGGMYKAWLAVW